jgi:hypothetical protein
VRRAVLPILAVVLAALAAAPLAGAKKVPTTPQITGAVYTTVDLNDPNYKNECHNGNPAVNCNQYTAKQFVYLNGGPAKNHLSPDGVYFYAVLVPGGQPNPNDGSANNLSDDYDCYQNRLVQITHGEVAGIYSSTEPSCFHNTAVEPVATPHKIDAPNGPFVQLWPYADTTNPGGVYIMAVCYVGPTAATPLPAGGVDPSLCKYDAFKVLFDTTPPVCKLVSKTLDATGKITTSITVTVQDVGAGLESVDYTTSNATASFPSPLGVGQTDPWYITATKDVLANGSSLALTATDTAGNQIFCDPAYGLARSVHVKTIAAGGRAVIGGLRSGEAHLLLTSLASGSRAVTVRVDGRRFATVQLAARRKLRLNLQPGLLRHRGNVVSVSVSGRKGRILVRLSN